MNRRSVIHSTVSILLICAGLTVAYAGTSFQLETEGYIDPGHHVYLRVAQSFDSGKTTGVIGPAAKWDLPNEQNIRGFLWYRFNSDGLSWIGPEVWPHINLGPKITLDAELRYMWAASRNAHDRWFVFTSPMYQLDKRNSVGVFVAHMEIQGDGISQPWFLGPSYTYQINPSTSLSLTYSEGLESGAGQSIAIDYSFNQ